MDFQIQMEELLARCEAEYEANKADSFLGTILKAKWDMLQLLYLRSKENGKPEVLLEELKEKRKELEKAKEKEEAVPTFDWYDEHYYYKLYDGQSEACRIVIDLLERGVSA